MMSFAISPSEDRQAEIRLESGIDGELKSRDSMRLMFMIYKREYVFTDDEQTHVMSWC